MRGRFLASTVAVLTGDPIVRFAETPEGSSGELARLERRYEMGHPAGRDPQAGSLRRRIAELRRHLSDRSRSERSSK